MHIMYTLLVVEDEASMLATLIEGFRKHHFVVHGINDGIKARLTNPSDYDCVILDWMLPHTSGVDIIKYWREIGYTTPVLMLTARTQTHDKVLGLEVGADDYMEKFFEWPELVARVHALIRRSRRGTYTWGAITINTESHEALVDQKPITLTKTEFAILEYCMQHSAQVLSKEKLLSSVWRNKLMPEENTLEKHIATLRKKIHYDFLETIQGVGYRLRPQPKVSKK